MGNKKSVPDTNDPYEILGVERGASPQEIRRRYTDMLLAYHPTRNKASSDQKVIQIREAYQAIVEGRAAAVPEPEPVRINLDAYTSAYFEGLGGEFYSTVEGLFELLCQGEPRANYPKFGGRDAKNFDVFYSFFSKFRTQRTFSRNKAENKALQKSFNQKVRKILDTIARHDERLKVFVSEKPAAETYYVKEKRKKSKRTHTEFECARCKRGFRSKNQLISHLRSKRHMESVMCAVDNYREYIEREIQNAMEAPERREAAASDSTETSESSETRAIREREKNLRELYARMERTSLHGHQDMPEESEPAKESTAAQSTETGEKAVANAGRPDSRKEKGRGAKKSAEKKYKNAGTFISGESVHFLTCAICREAFESRNKLFVHLREHHALKK